MLQNAQVEIYSKYNKLLNRHFSSLIATSFAFPISLLFLCYISSSFSLPSSSLLFYTLSYIGPLDPK